MLKSLFILTSFVFFYHGIINAQITDGCDTTSKTCYQFSDCAETANPSDGNVATIETIGADTVRFQLQFTDANIGWIAIGFSETASMPNTYVFMCQQEGSSFAIRERFAPRRSRPPVSGVQLLTAVSSTNAGDILNCTFTSPVTRTPMLNNPSGYWILLARGPYSNGDIQFHGSTRRCVSSSRSVITTAAGASSPSNAQITDGCDTAYKTCYQFSDCAETSNPSDGNIATIETIGDDTIRFQLQYADASIGWIAIGFSDTASIPNAYIFMCQQNGSSFAIRERFASERSLPPVSSEQLLTTVSSTNAGGILNCTFTSPVTRTPMLNDPSGYWILLARGQYNNGDVQNHEGTRRCISSSMLRITTAVGSGSSTIIPVVRFIFTMVTLVFASFLLL